MKFNKLYEMVPYVTGGKSKILTMHPYNAITLAMPGRHASQTDPPGGDFVVMVDDDNMDWTRHQFTHANLFGDLALKAEQAPDESLSLMEFYLKIILGADPAKPDKSTEDAFFNMSAWGIHPQTFCYAVQCLAVAEHRRYHQHEAKFGGRYLPFRAAAGIVEGLWTAAEAGDRTRTRGRIGIEWLEKDYGVPTLTKELMTGP